MKFAEGNTPHNSKYDVTDLKKRETLLKALAAILSGFSKTSLTEVFNFRNLMVIFYQWYSDTTVVAIPLKRHNRKLLMSENPNEILHA